MISKAFSFLLTCDWRLNVKMAEEQSAVAPNASESEETTGNPANSANESDPMEERENGEQSLTNIDENLGQKSVETGDEPIHRSPLPDPPQDNAPEPMDTSSFAVEDQSPDVRCKGDTNEDEDGEKKDDAGDADKTGNEAETKVAEVSDVGRIKITVKTQDETKVVSVGPDATVAELKLAVSSNLKLSVNRICLIFSGKMLLDEETLEMHDIADGSTVFLVAKPLQQSAELGGQQSFAFTPEQFSTIGTMPVSFTQLQSQLQKQMASNPDLVRQLIDNPLVQQLMRNPSVMKEMMMSVPQSKDLLERHPEISDLLSNQEVMKQTLELARDPVMLDAVLAQTEQANADSSVGFSIDSGFAVPGFNLGTHSSVPDGAALLQQLAANPQLVQKMLEAPYMPTVMEGLAKNPLWAQQMIAHNPLFAKNPHLQQQTALMMPYYIQQMQNPEMLALMTNPKALQAMLRIQQGMNVLQSEAPNLAGSIGLPYMSVPPSPAAFANMHCQSGAGDAGKEAFAGGILGAQYDPFSIMMSQIVQQMANKQLNLPPEQRYVEQLDRLFSMGFTDRESNLQVLIGTFGDVTAAADQLMRQRSK